ncbi:hypothetical protein FPV67DRAFT_847055 [Lyophyllum atratum]|nr:hypothetical protein FPV67DRAFT_847055 [Lyophyllum atratum]
MSVSSNGHSLPVSSNVSDAEDMGGISDDVGENAERQGLKDTVKPTFPKVKLLAKVEPTTSVAEYVPPSTAAIKLKKKQDIRAKEDLPAHLKYAFEGRFLPRLREILGITRAWERPEEAEVRDLWNEVFPEEELSGWLEVVVKKLVENNISNWRAKIAATALDAFKKNIIPALPDQTSEGISEWCDWALSGNYKKRPFYYQTYEEEELGVEEGAEPEIIVRASGMFLHPLILATLSYHYSSISQIHASARSEERPEGALVTAIQASQRAISRWARSGTFLNVERPFGDFSKDNWGDNPTRLVKNFPHLPAVVLAEPNATSNLTRVVKKLNDNQWDRIINGAISAIRRQKTITVQAPIVEAVPDPESDFELQDDAE